MKTISLPAANAALAAAGHVRLVRLPGPVEGLVGSRVAIWADTTEPAGLSLGEWLVCKSTPSMSWVLRHRHGTVLPLHPGRIVGSAEVTVLPVVERTWPPNVTEDCFSLHPPGSDASPRLVHWRAGSKVGRPFLDQLPFLPGLKPGDHVGVLADAARCEDHCPRCNGWGTATAKVLNGYVVETKDCSTCDGRGSCDPIPHPGPPEPLCDGLCVDSSDIGVPGYGIAYPHPGCPLHDPGEVCRCDTPDRCSSPTHDPSYVPPGGDGVDLWDWQP